MLILVSIWAIAANWIACNKGFYHLPKQGDKTTPSISHLQLIVSFGLYFLFSYGAVAFLLMIAGSQSSITMITAVQFSVMVVLFLSLQSFFYNKDRTVWSIIWKDKSRAPNFPIGLDFLFGMFTWLLSFPIVTVVSDLLDKLLKTVFNFEHYEQNAVKFVQLAAKSPPALLFALFSVLVMAPLVEEFLFRGVLQTYFKKRLGAKSAILLSALLFAFFHFSIHQGLGNVSLISSLLILGGFLGFLYEKRGSLWAPIGLHVAFNVISAVRILFFPETS